MAGVRFAIATPEIALTANTARTLWQVAAAANHRVKIKAWSASAKGVDPVGTPILLRLMQQTSAGTGGTSMTEVVTNGASETVQAVAIHSPTAEPTYGDVLAIKEVHPQNGWGDKEAEGSEFEIAGGARVGLVALSTANITMVADGHFEE